MDGNTKILIAEDEIDIGQNYKIILESRNRQITLAKDGKEWVERSVALVKDSFEFQDRWCQTKN
jgi:hypothetical protein